jgi:hypothetical protein
MNPKARRWIEVLRKVLPEYPDLVEAVKQDDDPEIIRLLQRYEAEARRDLDDFRRAHGKLDAKVRRLGRLESEYFDSDLDWDVQDDLWNRVRELQNDPEVEWYEGQVETKRGVIKAWRNRVEWAKDIVGIEPVRSRYADEDD